VSTAGTPYPSTLAVPLDVAVRNSKEGEWVVWRVRAPRNIDYGFARGEQPHGCLTAFLKLENASMSQFPIFVRKWGVLGICSNHGLPGVHNSCSPRQGESTDELFPRTSLTEGWTVPLRTYQEPIEKWRTLAGTLGATIRIGQHLQKGELGDTTDLVRLFGKESADLTDSRRAVGKQRRSLALVINSWLAEARANPVFTWPITGPTPELALDTQEARNDAKEFSWPARSLYPQLLTELVEELANP